MNAFSALSIYSGVWAADSCTLILAFPTGTTGKLNPITYMLCFYIISSANSEANLASPKNTGAIGQSSCPKI